MHSHFRAFTVAVPSMSQFAFANELKNCVRMDEPITKGPIPRWQRKCIEASSLRFVFCNIQSDWNEGE